MSSTPLHDACKKKNEVSLGEILERLKDGSDDVMKKDQNGRLPIHVACVEEQSFEVIDALIKAYPEGLKELDLIGWLPIHYECMREELSFEVIEALIKAYPDGLQVPDNYGRLPIHWEYPEDVKVPFIIRCLPIIRHTLENLNWIWMRLMPCFEVIEAIFMYHPEDRNGFGRLPIHLACMRAEQSFEVIDALIKAYPDGLKEHDWHGLLPIHHACMRAEQSFEVIDALMKAYPDGLKEHDLRGFLPIHHACHARGMRGYKDEEDFKVIEAIIRMHPKGSIRVVTPSYILDVKDGYSLLHHACVKKRSFELIEALIGMCPEALGKKSKTDRTPFEWDYDVSRGGHFKELIQHLLHERETLLLALETLSQVDVEKENPDDRSQEADVENDDQGLLSVEEDRDSLQYQRILIHCKNYVPLDILGIGFLDEKTLEMRSFLEWFNGMLCKRSVVCMMVLEFYLHMAWIYTFVSASRIYFVESDEPLGWRPTALLVFAAMFLLEEILQITRLSFTGALLHYCTDLCNWIDIVTCIMVIVSAVRFLDEDSGIDGRLLMTTGCLQSLLLLSYLRKTVFPFSKFVSGVIKIIWAVLPFLVVSGVTLFTFSFMYFVQDQDKLKNSDLVLVVNNTSNLEDEASFASLISSFQTVFDKFAGGAKDSLSALDFFFGIIVAVVLLNVVIAEVSDKWEKAGAEANEAFWTYRLDLIIEKTRGCNLYWSLCNSFFNGSIFRCLRNFGVPIANITRGLIREWEWNLNENNYCDWGSHLDVIFIDPLTVGTTMEEFKMKLAVKNKKDGIFACIKLLMECFVFFVLGFPTFGLLWPKFIRQMLFTQSKPKESSYAEEREIAKEVSKLLKKVVDQNESLAEYKKTVSELSQKVSAQNDLLEQLLKKVS